jgi:hypothetical protein
MKHMIIFSLALLAFCTYAWAQTENLDPQNKSRWQVVNRNAYMSEPGKVELNAADNDGLLILSPSSFQNGTIEFDVKGEDKMNQSFVGIAFHVQSEKEFEAVYFRPFNFFNPDTVRRWRAVQYIYMPEFPWEKLRESFPGKYENKLPSPPDPNGWFHVKVTVDNGSIKAFLNNNPNPVLQVQSLSKLTGGKIGFWVGNGSRGSFSNLIIKPS